MEISFALRKRDTLIDRALDLHMEDTWRGKRLVYIVHADRAVDLGKYLRRKSNVIKSLRPIPSVAKSDLLSPCRLHTRTAGALLTAFPAVTAA